MKHLYNSHLRKLPIAHGEVSVMALLRIWNTTTIKFSMRDSQAVVKSVIWTN